MVFIFGKFLNRSAIGRILIENRDVSRTDPWATTVVKAEKEASKSFQL